MQIGCGIRTMTVKGHDYLYFWHYETREGRRRAVHTYMGPVRDPEASRKAVEAMDAYARKAIDEARRRLAASRAVASSRRALGSYQ